MNFQNSTDTLFVLGMFLTRCTIDYSADSAKNQFPVSDVKIIKENNSK